MRGSVVSVAVAVAVACGGSSTGGTGAVDRGRDAGSGGGTTSAGGATGSSGTSGRDGSSGGGGSSGSSAGTGNAGEGGAAGGSAAGVLTEHAACVTYLNAECNRQSECAGGPVLDDPCPGATRKCPDYFFSSGTTRTVEGMLACAETWKTYPCEKFFADEFPPCASNGTLPAGSVCLFGSQCASGICLLRGTTPPGHPDCGYCITAAKEGDPCNYTTGPGCDLGLECDQGTDRCVTRIPFGLPIGTPCERYGQCKDGAICIAGTCQIPPPIGADCSPESYCARDAYCATDSKCTALPSVGMPCGLGRGSVEPFACTPDAFCDASAAGGPTCALRLAGGAPCTFEDGTEAGDRCAAGFACVCEDASCAAATCIENVQEGAACGAPNTRCIPGTICQGGVCVSASQELYAAACE